MHQFVFGVEKTVVHVTGHGCYSRKTSYLYDKYLEWDEGSNMNEGNSPWFDGIWNDVELQRKL